MIVSSSVAFAALALASFFLFPLPDQPGCATNALSDVNYTEGFFPEFEAC